MKVPRMNLVAAAIRKFGLEIGNHCMEIPETSLLAAAIVKLTPSNQESVKSKYSTNNFQKN